MVIIMFYLGSLHNNISSFSEYLSSSGSEQQRLVEQMAAPDGPPVLFAIHKNLTVVVKKVKCE